MKPLRWILLALLAAALSAGGTFAASKEAKDSKDAGGKKTKPPAVTPKGGAPAGVTLNACGCYHKGNACVCTDKKAKCDCPEDCEPVGCEEKRQKEIEREIAAETKKAQEEDKKREAAEAEAARAREKAQREAAEKEEDDGDQAAPDQQEQAQKDPGDDQSAAKPAKPARKGRDKK
jgi:hypothetical protein